ncbi:hypothetical protein M6B38_141650 [Iris pallida]|uniref:Uncharacterized protein n=1 Tax=Iris pallida TaxID=29817 RepID=A0AAX6FBT5_IRIPA|nr:hypothetical protein M6B38_141650 [Iris pallida]
MGSSTLRGTVVSGFEDTSSDINSSTQRMTRTFALPIMELPQMTPAIWTFSRIHQQ